VFFEQIKRRGDNFSYIIADDRTKEAVIVDPNFNADAIFQIVRRQNLTVKYIVNTHGHHDHTAGNKDVQSKCGGKIVAHRLAMITKDVSVEDGDVLKFGHSTIKVIYTPGHSKDSICLLCDNKLLTGDTLFVGECGITDSSESAKDMYNSLFHKLMKLEDNIEVYPGHDYGASPHSTIGNERRTNYTLEKRTLEQFIEFMQEP
jgi:hydroxyacylglutathione hydrolase